MSTWYGDPPPPGRHLGAGDWARVAARGGVAVAVMGLGLPVLGLARLIERPGHGAGRPWSGQVVRGVCRVALACIGLRLQRRGAPMQQPGAVVANHASWLDILALNACAPVQFVSKAEVAGWPGIGWLARAAGTLFIRRDAREVQAQGRALTARIRAGQRLVLFPEGTSSDGRRVLPFKSALFQVFFAEGAWVQPVTILYRAPPGRDPRFFGWWGDMALGPHLAQVLAHPGGTVEVLFHAPVKAGDFAARKSLAAACEAAVRAPMDQLLSR